MLEHKQVHMRNDDMTDTEAAGNVHDKYRVRYTRL